MKPHRGEIFVNFAYVIIVSCALAVLSTLFGCGGYSPSAATTAREDMSCTRFATVSISLTATDDASALTTDDAASASTATDDAGSAQSTDGGSLMCDPALWQTPECPAGQVCTSVGVCDGPACGHANTVCDHSGTICDASADCMPECFDAGNQPFLTPPDAGSTCEAMGLITLADLVTCSMPCFYFACKHGVTGGHCGTTIPFSKIMAYKARLEKRLQVMRLLSDPQPVMK
jgi:hypothetical protein